MSGLQIQLDGCNSLKLGIQPLQWYSTGKREGAAWLQGQNDSNKSTTVETGTLGSRVRNTNPLFGSLNAGGLDFAGYLPTLCLLYSPAFSKPCEFMDPKQGQFASLQLSSLDRTFTCPTAGHQSCLPVSSTPGWWRQSEWVVTRPPSLPSCRFSLLSSGEHGVHFTTWAKLTSCLLHPEHYLKLQSLPPSASILPFQAPCPLHLGSSVPWVLCWVTQKEGLGLPWWMMSLEPHHHLSWSTCDGIKGRGRG